MVNYRLVYFNLRGIAEPIRMIFHYANEDFDDKRLELGSDEFKRDYKLKSLNGHVPILELDDGRRLHESFAIASYLGKQFGLVGKSDWDAAKVDEVAHIFKDFTQDSRSFIRAFIPMFKSEKSNDELQKEVLEPAMQAYFPIFERLLKESASGYLVSCGITWIDFFVEESLTTLTNLVPGVLTEKYAELEKYRSRVRNHPNVRDYVASRKDSRI